MARELVVSLVGDASKFVKSLDDAEGKANSWSGGVGKLAKAAGGLLAGAGILSFGKDAVTAFNESAQAQSKLTQALQASPATIGVTADAFSKLNKELAKHTVADDDIIAAGEGVLATFDLTKKQIEDTIPGVVDLAAKLGTDIPGAADVVGKALLGNTKALKSLGIDGFKPTGDRANDLAALMGLLDTKTRGAAQAQLDAAGPGARFNKSMDELKETVGSQLVPALTKATEWVSKAIDYFAQHPTAVKFAEAVGVIAAAVWGVNTAVEAWTAAQAALDVVLAANPIGLVIAGIAVLAAGIYELYQHFGPFHDAVDRAWQLLQSGFHWVQNNWPLLLGILTGPIGLAVEQIITHWNGVVNFITGLPGKIGNAAHGMWDGIKNAFRDALNWVIDRWNGLEFKVHGVSAFGHEIGGFTLGVPDIPRLATGGAINGLALVGEKGPELFAGQGTIIPNNQLGGSTTINLYISGSVVTEGQLVDAVHTGLLKKQTRTGNLGFEAA